MEKTVIGIQGLAGSGKSTVAGFLKESGFTEIALADVMKRFCKELFDFSDAQLWGDSSQRNEPDLRYPRPGCLERHLTPRRALQQLGTEYGRNCYQDVWVDYALEIIKSLSAGSRFRRLEYCPKLGIYQGEYRGYERHAQRNLFVISDVRFDNEALAIRKFGGRIWRIVRPDRAIDSAASAHVSEAGVSDELIDVTVCNDSDLADLREQVACIRAAENRGEDARGR